MCKIIEITITSTSPIFFMKWLKKIAKDKALNTVNCYMQETVLVASTAYAISKFKFINFANPIEIKNLMLEGIMFLKKSKAKVLVEDWMNPFCVSITDGK